MDSLAWQDGQVQLAYAVHNHMQILFYSQAANGSIYAAMSSPQISDINVMDDGSCRMTLSDTVTLFFSNIYLRTLRIFDDGPPDYENVAIDGARYACGPSRNSTVSDGCIFARLEPGAPAIGINGLAMGTMADFNIGTLHYAIGEGDSQKRELSVSEFPSCRHTVATTTPAVNVFRSTVDRKVTLPLVRDVRFMPAPKRARVETASVDERRQSATPQQQAQSQRSTQRDGENRVNALVEMFRNKLTDLETNKGWYVARDTLPPNFDDFTYAKSASVNQVIVADGKVVVPEDPQKARTFNGIRINPTKSVLLRKESAEGIRIVHDNMNSTMPIQLAIGFLFAYIISLETQRR